MQITFDHFLIYNIEDFMGKKVNFGFTLMTGNGIETFYTPVYTITDNLTKTNYYHKVFIE